MSGQSNEISRLFASFEECCFQHEGTDAWRARGLMPRLGYANWQNFREAIKRAHQSCVSAGIEPKSNFLLGDGSGPWNPEEVFTGVSKNPQGGRPSEDVILTRRAAFLVVMNGDPSKPEIAFGQQYFAVSTRTLEVIQQRLAEASRLEAREKLTETESRFQAVLFERDVDGAAIARIRSKGDEALFGKPTRIMKEKWLVPSKRPLADFAPEVAIIAKQLGAAMTAHNVSVNETLRGEAKITVEHVANNTAVNMALKDRIQLGELDGAEDIQKVKRRHEGDVKKLAKPDPKPKAKAPPKTAAQAKSSGRGSRTGSS